MPERGRWSRRSAALVLLACLPTLSVAVPLLDCGLHLAGTTLHSPHDAGSHHADHDHNICIQYATNLSYPSAPPAPLLGHTAIVADPPADEQTFVAAPAPPARARAPPSA